MFNKAQLEQIELGIQQGLDVSIYAKEGFSWAKMWVIRKGLEKGYDISEFEDTDPELFHLTSA